MSATTIPNTTAITCQWCGMIHNGTCPKVSAIEYHPNGAVKRVEFHDATGANGRRMADWCDTGMFG
ncbi:MAG TPA: hypothetical protein VFS41_04565 [Edaphobacter sp.]|nr:hypothetical protein [Edaphobacter sp.]